MNSRNDHAGPIPRLLGPLAVCFSTVVLVGHVTGRPWSPPGVVLFASGVVAVYALDFWADRPAPRPWAVLLLVVVATLTTAVAALELPGWKITLAAGLGLIGLVYRRFKKWPLAKTLLVAGGWTAASICYPVQWDAQDLLHAPFGGVLLALFAANALLCDLKDERRDARAGVRTAPVLWGQRVTAMLAAALALSGMVAALLAHRPGLAGAGLALLALAAVPRIVAQPILGPALADAALTLPAVLILAGWA